MATSISCQSIFFTEAIMNTPTMMSAGAVAAPGIIPATGARRTAKKNSMETTTEVRPVLPPSEIPVEDSTNVVTVEVPRRPLRRGRSVKDFEYEREMALINYCKLEVETIFIISEPGLSYVSSSSVREMLAFGADVKGFVPDEILDLL